MSSYHKHLAWLSTQLQTMASLTEKWASINTGSTHLAGLAQLLSIIKDDFSVLGGKISTITFPPRHVLDKEGNKNSIPAAHGLSIRKRPEAPIQILLGGHMDTVYSPEHPFQQIRYSNDSTMIGPGVTDMKGGLAILLKTLECFEQSPNASAIGWEIFLNPDEEIGSPCSAPFWKEAARRNQIGLLFEPSFEDGSCVSARKGSANYTLIARGKAAHAGRDFSSGRNAIYALTRLIGEIERMGNSHEGATINVGYIQGGGPTNIVPDYAMCRFNIRAKEAQEMIALKQKIETLVEKNHLANDISLNLIEESWRTSKPFDSKTQQLFGLYEKCANELEVPFGLRESGGVCDGNILSAEGLPTLDSIGVQGGNIHTDKEYLHIPSLVSKAQIAALFLFKIAAGETILPKETENG